MFVTCILTSKSTVLCKCSLMQMNCHKNALQRYIAMIISMPQFKGPFGAQALDLLPPLPPSRRSCLHYMLSLTLILYHYLCCISHLIHQRPAFERPISEKESQSLQPVQSINVLPPQISTEINTVHRKPIQHRT